MVMIHPWSACQTFLLKLHLISKCKSKLIIITNMILRQNNRSPWGPCFSPRSQPRAPPIGQLTSYSVLSFSHEITEVSVLCCIPTFPHKLLTASCLSHPLYLAEFLLPFLQSCFMVICYLNSLLAETNWLFRMVNLLPLSNCLCLAQLFLPQTLYNSPDPFSGLRLWSAELLWDQQHNKAWFPPFFQLLLGFFASFKPKISVAIVISNKIYIHHK